MLSAVLLQNKSKFAKLLVSGVVALTCARHNMFISIVDLQKGERHVTFFLRLRSLSNYTGLGLRTLTMC